MVVWVPTTEPQDVSGYNLRPSGRMAVVTLRSEGTEPTHCHSVRSAAGEVILRSTVVAPIPKTGSGRKELSSVTKKSPSVIAVLRRTSQPIGNIVIH